VVRKHLTGLKVLESTSSHDLTEPQSKIKDSFITHNLTKGDGILLNILHIHIKETFTGGCNASLYHFEDSVSMKKNTLSFPSKTAKLLLLQRHETSLLAKSLHYIMKDLLTL
jgi:hypothetical protein